MTRRAPEPPPPHCVWCGTDKHGPGGYMYWTPQDTLTEVTLCEPCGTQWFEQMEARATPADRARWARNSERLRSGR